MVAVVVVVSGFTSCSCDPAVVAGGDAGVTDGGGLAQVGGGGGGAATGGGGGMTGGGGVDAGVPRLLVDPGENAISLSEGQTTVFTVRLSSAPAADVTVNVVSNDPMVVSVSTASLTFTTSNWSTEQSVTVTGVQDANVSIDMGNITLSSAGLADVVVAATVYDDDVQSIVVMPTSVMMTEGTTTNLTVRLAIAPSADVTVNVVSDDTTKATVMPSSLVFTPANFATPQTLTIEGVEDADTDHNILQLILSGSGVGMRYVVVQVNDND
jgi:hypothetical protein